MILNLNWGYICWGGKIVKLFKKIKAEGNEDDFPIRNVKNGYHYQLRNLEKYKKLPKYMDKVFEVFPIQMSRFDVGWDKANKTYRIIESNSAPILLDNPNTLSLYGDFLITQLFS